MVQKMINDKKRKKIVVLHVLNKMDRAGAEMLIMNIMRKIDREKYVFKFLLKTREPGHFDEEILKLGGEIYYIDRFNGFNYFSYKKQLLSFLSQHKEIDIVHAHQGSSAALDTLVAKKAGFLTIAHSHNTYTNNPFNLKEILFKIVSYRTRFTSDVYIGCSRAALLSRFGKKIESKKECYLLNNGIEISKFIFSKEKRNKFRKQYDIGNSEKVFAFIGRLTDIKNPFFAIECFKKILNKYNDSRLLIAGMGPLKKDIENSLTNKVLLLGNIANVDELLSASDILVMPSLKEGFPVTLVEAQCSGISCLVSDRITKEVELSNNIFFLPIKGKKAHDIWFNKAVSIIEEKKTRDAPSEIIVNTFSDVSTINTISSIYDKLYRKKHG
jgi:glycosyltransferase involved in cell wall biosynthesis